MLPKSQLQGALIALGFVGYPAVSFLVDILNVPSRVVTVPYRAVFLIGALALLLAAPRVKLRSWSRLFLAIAGVFWSLYLVRLLSDTVYFPVQLGRPIADYWLFSIGMCFIPMLAFLKVHDGRTIDRALLLTAVLMTTVCGLAFLRNANVLGSSFGRVYANEALNPITLGHVGASTIVLALFLLMVPESTTKLPLWFIVLMLPLGGMAMVLSGSRSPAIAVIVCTTILLIHTVASGRRLRALGIGVVIACALPLIIERVAATGSSMVSRLVGTATRVEEGREGRIVLWENALNQFYENPLFGSSLDEKVSGTYPHNLVIESFMATGLFGGVAYVGLTLVGLVSAAGLLRGNRRHSWIALLFIQQFLSSMTSGALYTKEAFWCSLALVVAVASSQANWAPAARYNTIHTAVSTKD